MAHGPVVLQVYDLAQDQWANVSPKDGKLSSSPPLWHSLIERAGRYVVRLKAGASGELRYLSESEIQILEEIFEEWKDYGMWDLCEELHRILPEWKNPESQASGRKSVPIPVRDILAALGMNDEQIEEVRELAREKSAIARLMG